MTLSANAPLLACVRRMRLGGGGKVAVFDAGFKDGLRDGAGVFAAAAAVLDQYGEGDLGIARRGKADEPGVAQLTAAISGAAIPRHLFVGRVGGAGVEVFADDVVVLIPQRLAVIVGL